MPDTRPADRLWEIGDCFLLSFPFSGSPPQEFRCTATDNWKMVEAVSTQTPLIRLTITNPWIYLR